jgi:FkbM family methyltransferase
MLRFASRIIFGHMLPTGLMLPVLRGPLRGTRLALGSIPGPSKGASVYAGFTEPFQSRLMVEKIAPQSVFFDIGANIGFYTILASRLTGPGGTVCAFEPVMRNLAFLHRHIKAAGCENVTIISAACSNQPGIARFDFGENPAVGHLSPSGDRDAASIFRNGAFVPTITIDTFVTSTGLRPDSMKIDVEGAEYEVLQGARCTITELRPILFLSIHSDRLRQQCLEYLAALGYTSTPIEGEEYESYFCAPSEKAQV